MTLDLESIHYENDAFIEVGKMIGQQRNRYGISLKNLSSKLKLRYDVLEMIESGNFKAIDRRINVLGYLSSICKAIDLDDKVVLLKIGFSDSEILEKRKLKNIKNQINRISYSDFKLNRNNFHKIFDLKNSKIKKIIGTGTVALIILIYRALS